MVDVSGKTPSVRTARAEAYVRMSAAARTAVTEATLSKGDALVTAQVAGIMAAKQTAGLIPLAHPLALATVDVQFAWVEDGLHVTATATTVGPTGVELEAMVAVTVAALTLYDMTKAVDRAIRIDGVRLLAKSGGKSGAWQA